MPGRIDTHHHIVPAFWREWLADEGIDAGGLPVPEWSVEADLVAMDEQRIDLAVLSVSTPGVTPARGRAARHWARRLNEHAAEVVAEHPSRFAFFATLTLPDVEGAVAEAVHALDVLGAVGVVVHAHAGGAYLGDAAFTPLIEELDGRGAVLFVHPSELPGPAAPEVPAFAADFLLDTVRTAFDLAHRGVLDHRLDLKVLLSHAGGFLPFAASRLAGLCSPDGCPEHGLELLRRFHLDTALAGSPYAMASVLAFARPGHVVFGSDWPYAPSDVVASATAELDANPAVDHLGVDRDNALRLLPALAARLPAA